MGYVPKEMVRCLSVFLDVCYIAHRQDIDTAALNKFKAALVEFFKLHEVFHMLGARPTGFLLPR